MRVVLADLDGVARDALASLLRELPDVLLLNEVGTRQALARALRHGRADVLVLDDRLVEDGYHVLADLGMMNAHPRVVVVGVDDDPAFAARAERLGAAAWVAKDRADEDLPGWLEHP